MIELLDTFREVRVLCVGDLMLDRFVTGQVERISPEGPVPVFLTRDIATMLGGAGNVARNVSSLGGKVGLVAVVGTDVHATVARDLLGALDHAESDLVADPSRSTILKTRYVAAGQQLLRVDEEQAHAIAVTVEEEIIRRCVERLENCEAVVLSDYAKGVLTDRVLAHVIEAARIRGRPVIVDPKSRQIERYAGATVMTPNVKELAQMVGHPCDSDEDVVHAAREILDRGQFSALVVTRSEKGMTLVTADGMVAHKRAAVQEVFDVSGAGDTVVATLALALAGGSSLEAACVLANEAAGVAVSKSGTAAVSSQELASALHARFDSRLRRSPVIEHTEAVALVEAWREAALTIGFTNGCFDILHAGHVHLLNEARRHCDRLVVGLNSDASVRRLKGQPRPLHEARSRAEVLAGLAAVDAVVVFEEDTPRRLIEQLHPDVLVKGGDYTIDTVVGAEIVQARGGKVLIIDLVSGHSTTRIVDALQPRNIA